MDTTAGRMKVPALLFALLMLAAACGGGGDAAEEPAAEAPTTEAAPADTATGETPAEETAGTSPTAAAPADGVEAPQVAFTSPVQASYVNTRYGPVTYGPDFGLNISEDDFTTFDSHSTATQTALSGRADIVGGSFISHILVRQAGQDFEVFCPFLNLDDIVLVGRNGVDSVDDLFDPSTRVAVDSPGGAGAMMLNAILQANEAQGTVEDLPNTTILESSGLRATAFAADDADATVIHLPQFTQAQGEVDDGVVVASLYEDVPVFIKEAFAAPGAWLDENADAAAGFCASILMANRELPQDFETYLEAVQTYVEEPPDEEELREIFDLVQQYEFWPTEGGLDQEGVEYMIDIALESGLLEERPEDTEGIVNREILDRAVEMANAQG